MFSFDSYKDNPTHPYRVHPELSLKAIPTLFRLDTVTGKVVDRLIEGELHDVENVKKFVAKKF